MSNIDLEELGRKYGIEPEDNPFETAMPVEEVYMIFLAHLQRMERNVCDSTPNDDLRGLVEQWRDRRSDHGAIPEEWAASDAYDHAAEELEELIEDD